jgi:hypothetical protein
MTINEVGMLLAIKQNKTEDLSEYLSEFLTEDVQNRFEETGYVGYVKTKSTEDTIYKLIRTTTKANTFLSDIETPEIEVQDLKIFDWLFKVYVGTDKVVGNAKKTKMFIALFRAHSGIEKNQLAFLLKTFINDPEQFEWSKKLEFLFFKGASVFSTKFDIEQSRLYQYYLMNKTQFDKIFLTL